MQIFNRSKPRNVLFLMPVQLKGDRQSRSKVRMLYCDGEGRVYASNIKRSVFEGAHADAAVMKNNLRYFATVGLETSPGDFLPAIVEIDHQELWALEHISKHALKNGTLPDILKKHIPPIIRLGEAQREIVTSVYGKRKVKTPSETTPKVLDRLPYYREHDMEISVPIYKAEPRYPLIVLKSLPDKNGAKNQRSLLVLDSDGDLTVNEVPARLIKDMVKKLARQNDGENRRVCAVIYQRPKGKILEYMTISEQQQKALSTITKYFEETGSGKQPVSATVMTVINRAGKLVSPEAL